MKNEKPSSNDDLPDSLKRLLYLQRSLFSRISNNGSLNQFLESDANRLRVQNEILRKKLIDLAMLEEQLAFIYPQEGGPGKYDVN